MKLKKTYNQASVSSINMRIMKGKLALLDDMSTSIPFFVNNKNYIQIYYPLDDAIMNKGYLTLISPNYVSNLSKLLKLSSDKIKLSNYPKDTVIPAMRCQYEKDEWYLFDKK